MAKNIKFVITKFVFSRSKCTKIRFRLGLRAGPRWGSVAGGADAPPDPLVGWGGGYLLPIHLPARHLRRLELRLGSQAPQHKILATPVAYTNYIYIN